MEFIFVLLKNNKYISKYSLINIQLIELFISMNSLLIIRNSRDTRNGHEKVSFVEPKRPANQLFLFGGFAKNNL